MNFDNFTKLPDELKYRLFKDCVNNSMLVKLGGREKEVSLAPLIGLTGSYFVTINPVNHDGPSGYKLVSKMYSDKSEQSCTYYKLGIGSVYIAWDNYKSPYVGYRSEHNDGEEVDYIVKVL